MTTKMSRQIGEASSLINCGYLGSSPKASNMEWRSTGDVQRFAKPIDG